MKKYLALAFCAALPCSVVNAAEGVRKTFPAAGVKMIRIQTESGDIEVQGTGRQDAQVEVTKMDPERCAVTMEARGDALVLEIRSLSRWFWKSSGCQAGFKVQAPASLGLEASSGAGDIKASGLQGALILKDGSGDIRFDGVAGEVSAKSGSGNVEGTLRSSRVSIMTGSGDLKLRWTQAPGEGDVQVKTGSGDVSLAFPGGAKVRTSILSGVGTVSNELGEASDARLTVSVMSGSGDVAIRKLAAPARN